MKRIAIALLGLIVISTTAMAKEGSADRVQFGQSINVGPDETIGDAVCIGCSIHIEGQTHGDAVAVGGSIDVEGKVAGDTVAVGGGIRLGPEASVGGDATAIGGAVQRDPNATVGGEVTSNRHFPMMGGMMGLGSLFLIGLIGSIPFAILVAILCYLILGQQRIEVMVGALRGRTGPAILAGLGVLVGAAIVMFLFPHTGTLRPIVLIVVAIAVCITMIVGYTAVSMWAGRAVARGAGPMGAVIIGAIVVAVAQSIPFIGAFLFCVFALAAVGAATVTGFGTHSEWMGQGSTQ